MNKLLKYNNLKKYYNYIELKIPKQIKINYFHEIIKFSKYLDERKNTDKIILKNLVNILIFNQIYNYNHDLPLTVSIFFY